MTLPDGGATALSESEATSQTLRNQYVEGHRPSNVEYFLNNGHFLVSNEAETNGYMTGELSRSARRVQAALAALGKDFEVVQLPSITRTAVEAANAIGCSVEQIAKSIVFRTVKEKKPVMVIASGPNRVNEATIADFVGEPIEKADADYVRGKTGFAIGGVPPIGHAEPISIIIDEDLMRYGEVWAAAGTPNSVFKMSATSLLEMTAGTLMSIK